MTLHIVGADELPQEDLTRGVAAARARFDDHMIISDIVYKHVVGV